MLKDDFFRHVAQTSDESIALPVESADGVFLYGSEGQRWLDVTSGICVSNLGHGVPEIVQAIQLQAEQYLHPMVYGEVVMSPQVRYAKKLVEVLDNQLTAVYFTNSGAEAIEGALKVAKRFTGRTQLLACHNAYHGSTHGALSVTGVHELQRNYGPLLPEVDFLTYNSWEDLAQITEQTAAVVIEAIQGAGGVILPEPGYLQAVRERCTETGALLILDEIQTGFGRTGSLFAHQALGIKPDILVLAKSLGGGMPLGAFIAQQEVMQVIRRDPVLGYITTFGGHPVSCAAGLAFLEQLLASEVWTNIPDREAQMRKRLEHPAIQEVRGKGLLYAVVVKDYAFAEAVRKQALKEGLLTIGFLGISNGLRISPPLNITESEMDLACDLLLSAIELVRQSFDRGPNA
ncbi:MAG: aspartate aminotransferase family protein [Bacteroidota bacterium]